MSLMKNINLSFLSTLNNQMSDYPMSVNLNYSFGFGFLLGLCLMVQIFSGLFLAVHYSSDIELAFSSMQYMVSDVAYGWLMSSVHSNTASLFFVCIYVHIGCGIFYKLYTNVFVWMTGVMLFLLLMMTSFLGYMLPWGQMSYWGAVVITNLMSVIPFFGGHIVTWLWGGFSVSSPTLNSFFMLHYLFPFLMLGVSCLHILFLHSVGSSKNPINVEAWNCITTFIPYFLIKDMLGMTFFIYLLAMLVFFYPNLLGYSDNAMSANMLLTPLHMVPEWHFLPYYAILRAVPNKSLGVFLLLSSILVLLLLTVMPDSGEFSKYDLYHIMYFSQFVVVFFKLMWLGSQPIFEPYMLVTQISILLYFGYFLFLIPLGSLLSM